MTRRRRREPGPIARLRASRAARAGGDERGQGGFTLVETVVAMAVFGVTLIPTTGIFFGGMQAAAASNVRSDAVGVAASTLAQVRALPYNLVGFYLGQSNFVLTCPSSVAACATQSTVQLGSGTGPVGAFAPVAPLTTIGATTFTVTTYITWANANVPLGTCAATTSTCLQAYKEATVVVSWGGKNRLAGSVTESTLVYPGGQGQYTAAGGTHGAGNSCPGSPSPPIGVTAAAATNMSDTPDPGEYEVNLSWTPVALASEPCYYVVDVAPLNADLPATCASAPGSSVQASPWQPGTAASYTVTSGLTPGTQYFFAVIAYNSDGSQCAMSSTSPPVSATTDSAPPPTTCTVSSFTVTAVPSQSTAKTYEVNSGVMSDNLNLVVSTSGSGCSNLTVQGTLVNSTTQDPGSPYTLSAGTGGQYTYTVPSSGVSWTTGQHVFVVYSGTTNTGQQQSIEVCAHAGNGQKTNTPNVCP